MSEEVSFKILGLAAVEAQLAELGDDALAAKVLGQAARKAFKPVLDAARSKVPIKSGELRNSIRLSVKKPKSGDAVIVVGIRIAGKAIGKELPPSRRWHWIEFGTSNAAAQPFLRPSLDENASQVLDLLRDEIIKGIEKALKKKSQGGK